MAVAIGPLEDTHICLTTDSTDVLDIAIMKNVKWNWDIEVKHELTSDRLPVTQKLQFTRCGKRQQILRQTNWYKFKRIFKIVVLPININVLKLQQLQKNSNTNTINKKTEYTAKKSSVAHCIRKTKQHLTKQRSQNQCRNEK